MSASVFAELTGAASGRTVRRWEAGENDVPRAVVNICRLLGWLDNEVRTSAINHVLLAARVHYVEL